METKEKNDVDPAKVIDGSRTIRRPQAAVGRVHIAEPNVDDIRSSEREFVTEQQSEPSSEQTPPTDAIIPEPSESTTPSIAPAPKRQEQRESSGRRRGLPSYRDVFVSRNEIKHRQCVYISHEVHSFVSSLVRALVEEGGEITVGGYIDKVLYEHLQAYKDEINELYRNRRPELLK